MIRTGISASVNLWFSLKSTWRTDTGNKLQLAVPHFQLFTTRSWENFKRMNHEYIAILSQLVTACTTRLCIFIVYKTASIYIYYWSIWIFVNFVQIVGKLAVQLLLIKSLFTDIFFEKNSLHMRTQQETN